MKSTLDGCSFITLIFLSERWRGGRKVSRYHRLSTCYRLVSVLEYSEGQSISFNVVRHLTAVPNCAVPVGHGMVERALVSKSCTLHFQYSTDYRIDTVRANWISRIFFWLGVSHSYTPSKQHCAVQSDGFVQARLIFEVNMRIPFWPTSIFVCV